MGNTSAMSSYVSSQGSESERFKMRSLLFVLLLIPASTSLAQTKVVPGSLDLIGQVASNTSSIRLNTARIGQLEGHRFGALTAAPVPQRLQAVTWVATEPAAVVEPVQYKIVRRRICNGGRGQCSYVDVRVPIAKTVTTTVPTAVFTTTCQSVGTCNVRAVRRWRPFARLFGR